MMSNEDCEVVDDAEERESDIVKIGAKSKQ